MKPATLLRLAFAGGGADTVRVVLTSLSGALATVVLLSASAVIAIPKVLDGRSNVSPQYGNALIAEAGLRPGVTFVLVLLTVPVLVLAGQSARLGAPARDRRLAALRMAGATPRQVIAVASAETGIAAAAGVVIGLGCYLAGRQLLHRPDPVTGKLPLPTDVLAPSWAIVGVSVGVPALAALVAAVLLRRVAFTPFGVVRQVRDQRPGPWPGLLIAFGIGVFLVLAPLSVMLGRVAGLWHFPVFQLLILLGVLSALAGVVLGTAWISYAAGWVLHRYARRPAALLAARRLLADPWAGARTLAALLGVVLLAAAVAGFRASIAAQMVLEHALGHYDTVPADIVLDESAVPAEQAFYFQAMDLVNLALVVAAVVTAGGLTVALGESVVSRRRTFATLVATGVPRRTLVGVVAWQSLTPLLPGIGLALGVGLVLARTLYGEAAGIPAYSCNSAPCLAPAPFVMDVPVPVTDLAVIGVGAAAVALLVLAVGLLFVRPSTALDELRAT